MWFPNISNTGLGAGAGEFSANGFSGGLFSDVCSIGLFHDRFRNGFRQDTPIDYLQDIVLCTFAIVYPVVDKFNMSVPVAGNDYGGIVVIWTHSNLSFLLDFTR